MRQITLLLAVAACTPQGTLPQMEDAGFQSEDWDDRLNSPGTLTVAPGATNKDWDLALTNERGAWTFQIHSPTALDLSGLDGIEGVQYHAGYHVLLYDADGPLYAAYTHNDVVAPELQELLVDSEILVADGGIGFGSMIFDTDDGPVELRPGEVEPITYEGRHYELGAIRYLRKLGPRPTGHKCTPIRTNYAWELVWAPTTERSPRTTASDGALAKMADECG
jgi:hypothetical protein